MPPVSSICLIGMMGAGKSTVGPLLAEQLGRPFIDLDSRIESDAGMSVGAIFKEQGEVYFRELERRVLADNIGGNVIACGGGIVTQPECRAILGRQSTVYLRANVKTLEGRLKGSGTRPLLTADASRSGELLRLLDQRQPYYEQAAQCIVDVDDLSPDKIVEAITRQI